MEDRKNSSGIIALIAIGVAAGGMFSLPYLRDTYFIALREGLNFTNAQLGQLLSIYGVAFLVIGIPCGWLADRFSVKSMLLLIIILTAIGGFWYATLPGYTSCLIIFCIWSFTTTMYWPLLTKVSRSVGGEKNSGKMYGMVESTRTATYAIMGFVSVALFAKLGSGTIGIQGVILLYSIILVIVAIVTSFALKKEDEAKKDVIPLSDSFKQALSVIKNKKLWLLGISIFATLSMYICSGMIVPYLEEVYGLSSEYTAIFGIFRASILGTIAGLTGGIISGKLGSITKMMIIAYTMAIILTVGIILIPGSTKLTFLIIVVSLALIFAIVTNKTMYMAPLSEIGIPMKDTGMASVVLSMIGFSCEIFMYTLVGGFIDKNPGIIGYRNVFYLLIFYAILGIIATFALRKTIAKESNKAQVVKA